MGTGSRECSSAEKRLAAENVGRDIIVISHERIKCPEPKKDAKDRSTDGYISRKQGICIKTPSEACFAKETKISNSVKIMD